jgi:DNA-binding response OmpR family regulator
VEPANILLIEDDDIVARTIERCLRGSEFRVTITNSGVEGLQTARRRIPDLIILDVIMPGMDGYTVCREIRADPVLGGVPILFLTAKTKDEDRIAGFTAGADDYLSKPFNLDELILRVRAILRRTQLNPSSKEAGLNGSPVEGEAAPGGTVFKPGSPASPPTNGKRSLTIRGYLLDTRTYELKLPTRKKVRLTPVQFDLMYHLMSHPGEIFSPPRLLDEVWDYPSEVGSPDLVRVHIKNLRERIEDDPRAPTFIETVPGYGYTVRAEDD